MSLITYIDRLDETSGEDFLGGAVTLSSDEYVISLRTSYSEGKELYEFSTIPDFEGTPQSFSAIVKAVMPQYPGCSVEAIDRVHALNLGCLHNRKSPPDDRLKAAQFLLANRLIRAYNENFIGKVVLMPENTLTPSVEECLQKHALLLNKIAQHQAIENICREIWERLRQSEDALYLQASSN